MSLLGDLHNGKELNMYGIDVRDTISAVLGPPHSGKVRDCWELPDEKHLLMVASDRVSTHNVSHITLFPGKGEVLSALPLFFNLNVFPRSIETHMVAHGRKVYDFLPRGLCEQLPPNFHYRAWVVKKLPVTPVEFIFRNHFAGSYAKGCQDGWNSGYGGVNPYGYKHSPLAPLMVRFPYPLFTPTQKSANDESMDAAYVRETYSAEYHLCMDAFTLATAYLADRGITLIDAKFEASGKILVDEWFTGDCSRLALAKHCVEGKEPPWLDKECIRQAAIAAWQGGEKVPLVFPQHIVEEAMRKYHEAFERITRMTLAEFQKQHLD